VSCDNDSPQHPRCDACTAALRAIFESERQKLIASGRLPRNQAERLFARWVSGKPA
jgi:hypothetical protein